MKKIYFLFTLLFTTTLSFSQNEFITTWEVTSSDLSITIDTNSSYSYDYTVDFGDGVINTNVTGDITHTYSSAGIYTVKISGTFPSLFQCCTTNNTIINSQKLRSLEQWGNIQWLSMKRMFYYCSNMVVNATDSPDLSQVTDMSEMFTYNFYINQNINNWDVSNVTNMNSMFKSCYYFNQPLDNWDVSNVTDMNEMFRNCNNFNQDISDWVFNTGLSNLNNFLSGTNLSIVNYDKLLLTLSNSGISNLIMGVDGLEFCDLESRSYLFSQGWSIFGDSQSSDCNQIQGTIYYDFDNNGCTNTDIHTSNLIVDSNNGITSYSTFVTNSSYDISVYGGNQTVSLLNLPSYFTATPQSQTVDFSTTSTEQVDFCITANQVVEDLNITILPLDDARPGFESNYKLIIQNVGTETLNAVTANVVFDNSKQSFVSANPTATSTTANTLDFNIGTIQPFGIAEVDFVMQNFTPPTVNADDVLTFTATVLPDASDYTPNDNVFTLDQIVVNAYDPNDKRVLQGDEITMSQTTDYLDYIIRFQNTGSANATFVRIEDVLDPELDWSTLKVTSASHAYEVKITNGNEVEFLFDNINLAYEAADEPNSHGYIAYKIKPKTTVQLGDVFSGDASIYFDYNLPIITNTVSTTIVNNLSTDEFSVSQLISIYPNPVKEGLFLNTKNGVSITSAKIFDLKGNKLIDINNSVEYINTEALSSGIYLLSVQTNQGKISKKIIKK